MQKELIIIKKSTNTFQIRTVGGEQSLFVFGFSLEFLNVRSLDAEASFQFLIIFFDSPIEFPIVDEHIPFKWCAKSDRIRRKRAENERFSDMSNNATQFNPQPFNVTF